jgi:hypothetical protein
MRTAASKSFPFLPSCQSRTWRHTQLMSCPFSSPSDLKKEEKNTRASWVAKGRGHRVAHLTVQAQDDTGNTQLLVSLIAVVTWKQHHLRHGLWYTQTCWKFNRTMRHFVGLASFLVQFRAGYQRGLTRNASATSKVSSPPQKKSRTCRFQDLRVTYQYTTYCPLGELHKNWLERERSKSVLVYKQTTPAVPQPPPLSGLDVSIFEKYLNLLSATGIMYYVWRNLLWIRMVHRVATDIKINATVNQAYSDTTTAHRCR